LQTMGQRLEVRHLLASSLAAGRLGEDPARPASADLEHGGEGQALVVVAPVRSLLQRLAPGDPPEPVVVRKGESVDRDELLERLVAAGYRREYQVEHRGEVAVRGGIVDVFPSTGDFAIRLDLVGDEVERLAEMDPATQRSGAPIEEVAIYGCRELVVTGELAMRAEQLAAAEPWGRSQWERLASGQAFDGMESWLPWLAAEEVLLTDLLPADARVVLVDPRRMRDRAAELLADEEALASALASTWGVPSGEEASGIPRLHLPMDRLFERCRALVTSLPPLPESASARSVDASAWDLERADAEQVARRLSSLIEHGYEVTLIASSPASAERMSSALAGEGVRVASGRGSPGAERVVRVMVADLERGAVMHGAKVAILTEGDLTGRRRPHRVPRARARPSDGFFDDLAPGDYVVHRAHGVARYAGLVTRTVQGASREYLLLEYRGDDRLYLPTDQIEALTPYSGGDVPTLNRLGGSGWQRTRARAERAVEQVAAELVALYQERASAEGHAFGPDTPWQRELEESFPFVETPDQLKAVEEVKADMESPRPMDRLVCGDVGFGKTEVATRAIFKAVQDGKQAAVLVPTTLLARQHAETFAERFASFPVKVEMLSRFLTPSEERAVLAGLAAGSVDVVVGTHRLLGQDVRFKDLGLLVVDEEQRFGVSHKESIKALAKGVDVLTLTASPIPRTLEMALTGIRDLSLVNTPPAERQPILTYVGEIDEAAVVEAIRRELLREGQVFFVHNRVQDIEAVAARLRVLVPEARIAVAHGQMDEGTLERVVLDFSDQRYDVLVCTTIIESGIDMPTVNTLIVDRADRLGLGQLHQLRGRVGRAGERAYAYLFHPKDRVLTETAYERLRTIGENTELGSGFKIAMRDLEIRGAGNLLGHDQSGHIAAVGYDLYVQLVAEAVADMKGEPIRRPPEVTIELPVNASLPEEYVGREDLRLEAYRRLAAATNETEVDEVAEEWTDRFGPFPSEVAELLEVARLRAVCIELGVKEVTATRARPGQVRGIPPGRPAILAQLSPIELAYSARVRLRRIHPSAIYKEDARKLIVPLVQGNRPARELAELLYELVPALAEGSSIASS
jgi:transcription-repair coupling factor (superfamily II helicase)